MQPAVYCNALLEGLESTLPISDIDPAIELETDLLEVSHFRKTELFMQRDAGCVGQRYSPHYSADTSRLQDGEQLAIELRADSQPCVSRVEIDRDLR